MSARTLSHILFVAESGDSQEQDRALLRLKPSLQRFLGYLINPHRDREDFPAVCQEVYKNVNLSCFWQALAAHHRGVEAGLSPTVGPRDDPDRYFPLALALIKPEWYYPEPTKTELRTKKGRALAKARKHEVTPDAEYIYISNMRARGDLGANYNTGMLKLGTQVFINQGWFDAPSWTKTYCDRVGVSGAEGQQILARFTERSLQKDCYFSTRQHRILVEHCRVVTAA